MQERSTGRRRGKDRERKCRVFREEWESWDVKGCGSMDGGGMGGGGRGIGRA